MIYFSNADVTLSFKGKTILKSILHDLFELEGRKLTALNYVFCSDEYLLQINKDFLQHDYYTDIITFEMADDPMASGSEGEIYISVDRVRENALELGVLFYEELLRVIFHGALHLCGYKDKTDKDEQRMRRAEDQYLVLFKERTARKK